MYRRRVNPGTWGPPSVWGPSRPILHWVVQDTWRGKFPERVEKKPYKEKRRGERQRYWWGKSRTESNRCGPKTVIRLVDRPDWGTNLYSSPKNKRVVKKEGSKVQEGTDWGVMGRFLQSRSCEVVSGTRDWPDYRSEWRSGKRVSERTTE